MSRFYTNVFQRKDKIYVKGYDTGLPFKEVIPYKPYLFVATNNKSKYRTLDGKNADKIDFDSISDAKKFFEDYSGVTGMSIYGLNTYMYLYMYDNFKDQIKYAPHVINIVTIDIEVASDEGFPNIQNASNPITAITLRCRNRNYVFGCGKFSPTDNNTFYIECKDEHELIQMFLESWESLNPDIITGWNVEFFDIPYIVNRIRNLFGMREANRLSPWRILDERVVELSGHENQVYLPAGISILDYLQIYKKFSFGNQESYRLDFIATVELGEKKIDYSEYGSLLDLYKNNYQKFIEYNIYDCVLVDKLEEKLGFLQQIMALAYDAKVNYNDTLATVRPWDVIIHNYLMDRNIVIPQNVQSRNNEQIMGGHVKDVIPGMYKWVVSFDLNSLYPHLIMQYNISPDTYAGKSDDFPSIDELLTGKHKMTKAGPDGKALCAITANGTYYRKDKQGFLAELMQTMYDDRTKYKKMMIESKKEYEKTKNPELQRDISRYHNMQMAKKIQLNSAYGALANQYFRWFDNNLAEAITSSGQLSIRWIEQDMNVYMNKLLKTEKIDYIIAADTDSIYVNMGPLVEKLGMTDDAKIVDALDQFIEAKIQPYINNCYENLAEYMSAYQQKMEMKRECIANKGIWTAKKRYILNVYNQEGVAYEKPKLKITGIEAVRSSTPMSIRTNIKKSLDIIMNKTQDDIIEFIEDFRKEFRNLPFEDIAFPRGVKGLNKYSDTSSIYKKATPMHVKGALLYNYYISKYKLQKMYQKINDGDKIKFSYLIKPNPIHDTVIATTGALPEELNLHAYIDYDMQFEKGFLDPLKIVLNAIGWEIEKKASLEGLFG